VRLGGSDPGAPVRQHSYNQRGNGARLSLQLQPQQVRGAARLGRKFNSWQREETRRSPVILGILPLPHAGLEKFPPCSKPDPRFYPKL
jgi:hypothetical protein